MAQYNYKFKDDAQTTLAVGLTAAATSLQVVSGGGALFPALGSQEAFIATLIKNGTPAIKEVILVTGRSTDNMTGITRNLSGTGALTWNAGDIFAMLQPAEMFTIFPQIPAVQATIYNYAQDLGAANAYVALLNPPLNGRVTGMPIYFFIQHANTGASTLNDGIGTTGLLTADGEVLRPGDLQQFSICSAFFDGANYRLLGVHHLAFSQLNGSIANAQVPQSAVLQHEAALVIAFSQLTGQIFQSQIPNNLNLPGVPTAPTAAVNTSNAQIANTLFVNPASSAGSPGYFKTAGGILVQWGTANPNGGSVVVTFPTVFPSGFHIVTGRLANGPVQDWVTSPSGSGFTLHNSGGSNWWVAIGY